MTKYSDGTVQGYTFVSLEEMIFSIVDGYKKKRNIEIYAPWNETSDLIVALLSTGLFKPELLDWASKDMSGYGGEYQISINYDGIICVEPTWDYDEEKYIHGNFYKGMMVFVSDNVDINLIDTLIDDGYYGIIYYDFGETDKD